MRGVFSSFSVFFKCSVLVLKGQTLKTECAQDTIQETKLFVKSVNKQFLTVV